MRLSKKCKETVISRSHVRHAKLVYFPIRSGLPLANWAITKTVKENTGWIVILSLTGHRAILFLELQAGAKLDDSWRAWLTGPVSEIVLGNISAKVVAEGVPVPDIEKLGAKFKDNLLAYRDSFEE